jgi:hypothetical protein
MAAVDQDARSGMPAPRRRLSVQLMPLISKWLKNGGAADD